MWAGKAAGVLCSSLSLPSDWMNRDDGLVDQEADEPMPQADDEVLAVMEQECMRLRAHKRHLHAALDATHEKAKRAAEENRRLMRLIALLTPNKGSFQLLPQLSAPAPGPEASAVGNNSIAAAACQSNQGEVNRPGSRYAPSSDDPETVQAEAVAAAALALNKGNPAAALIDLLSLAVRNKHAQSRS
ncbi:hypothetical protein COCSUDRAFT_60287 [Coccomyxa subellipsoidea C-169]|uniref:Uncharacterized protein n=1 Tax=Coccomyxa subellipsoidea (strain C-169) TaxID=574566 RepID=I0YIU8_COCSC|nr:hypothetical protein COCSUDRAFT_60287 [Coccomyxa subellipsoidea C-169]EIE18317.1 hypothetical protein COCSUDRAFT_60287 [Coccomyxa subellipsoidea C-169]|eukprot:XP_005642861.1 hypothetical protein COCSUDRAFT_60287 [Coccomyxa subellipsoidea C-169]